MCQGKSQTWIRLQHYNKDATSCLMQIIQAKINYPKIIQLKNVQYIINIQT